MKITLKNYRCFADSNPVELVLRPGFTSFVGMNNSGKSCLLRLFYDLRPVFKVVIDYFATRNANLADPNRTADLPEAVPDAGDIFSNQNSRPLNVLIDFQHESAPGQETMYQLRLQIARPSGKEQNRRLQFTVGLKIGSQEFVPSKVKIESDGRLMFDGVRVGYAQEIIRNIETLVDSFYVGPYRNAIEHRSSYMYYDALVGQDFVNKWKDLKTGHIKLNNELTYRVTEEIKETLGFKSFEINASSDNITLQLFINGKSYKLSEIGSGLAHLIIILANAAIKKPSYILIDEPELNLHPSLQLAFLMMLGKYAECGVLFATHVYGLARTSSEHIYVVTQGQGGISAVRPMESQPHLSELLGELCFSGYQDLGCNRLLLVEGSTSVKVCQQFLRVYGKDNKYVVLPIGGRDLIRPDIDLELREVLRIAGEATALIDSERAVEGAPLAKEIQGFADACAKVGIRCKVLDRRAIENYFPNSAVKAALGERYSALAPYERLKDAKQSWNKGNNWRIAHETTIDDLTKTDLGIFFESI